MKKKLIPIAIVALLCGAVSGLALLSDEKNDAPQPLQYTSSVQEDYVRQPEAEFVPAFSAVNIPEQQKQHYTVNPKASQIITGNSGTLLLIPDNAFADKHGNPVEGKVKLELVEGITHEDIIKMNLSTMSDKGILETGGMIYVGAKTESGEDLVLAPGKTIETEIPAMQVKSGMQLWEGKENADGSITWINPEPINEGLRPVPIETLADSSDVRRKPADSAKVVRGFDSWGWMTAGNILVERWGVIAGDTVFRWKAGEDSDTAFIPQRENQVVAAPRANGTYAAVNFADGQFANTNISTAEFRSRLPFIRQACDDRISHCYADYPNRPLWKSDLAVADTLEKSGCALADLFRQFAKQKAGMIDPKDPNTTAAMDKARGAAIEKYSKRVRNQQAAYASYSFGMKKLGWANIDRLCGTGTRMTFNAHVEGPGSDAQPTVSLLIPGRGIFLPGYRRPNGDYSFTHGEYEQTAEYPKGEKAFILARSGSGDDLQYGLKEVILGTNTIEEVMMKNGSEKELALAMGNPPPEQKEESDEIIDDWYTQNLKRGNGCLCNSESGAVLPVVGWIAR